MTEDQLQQNCVVWFHNTYRDQRGKLFRTENKTNRNETSLGLVKGVSDLQYISKNYTHYPIELKINGTSHKVEHLRTQLNWIKNVTGDLCKGFFCFSETHFKEIIHTINNDSRHIRKLSKESLSYIEDLINGTKKKSVVLNFRGKRYEE